MATGWPTTFNTISKLIDEREDCDDEMIAIWYKACGVDPREARQFTAGSKIYGLLDILRGKSRLPVFYEYAKTNGHSDVSAAIETLANTAHRHVFTA